MGAIRVIFQRPQVLLSRSTSGFHDSRCLISVAEDSLLGEAVITVSPDGAVYGTIRDDDGSFVVRSNGTGTAGVVEHVDTGLEGSCSVAHRLSPVEDGLRKLRAIGNKRPSDSAPSKSLPPQRTVDVAVLYTAEAEYNAQGGNNMRALIDNAIADMNSSFSLTGVVHNARVVHYGRTTWSEFSVQPIEVDNVTGVLNQIAARPDVLAVRESVQADVVIVIASRGRFVDTCGAGNVILRNDPFYANHGKAFALTGDSCIADFRNFTHELGHVFGGYHDQAAMLANGIDPYHFDYTFGPFAYSFGWTSAMRTIMGSGQPCTMSGCQRINMWSRPEKVLGFTIGDAADGDMKRSLNEYLPVVADYRGAYTPVPGAPSSLNVASGSCYGLNYLSWPSASGAVGWYEVERSTSSSFTSPVHIYKGGGSTLELWVDQTNYVRVKSCNVNGCSAWRSSVAPYLNYCM